MKAVCLLVTLFVTLSLVLGNLNAATYQVTAYGCVYCHREPMIGVPVQLLYSVNERYWHRRIAPTRTRNSGCFRISGQTVKLYRKPRFKVEVQYSYNGAYGCMKIKSRAPTFPKVQTHSTSSKKYARSIYFGRISIADEHCRAYTRFYETLKDFHKRAPASPPLPYDCLDVITDSVISNWPVNNAFALIDTIRIPGGYRLSIEAAKHEFAHTVRHSYDGGLIHLYRNIWRYRYAQRHNCSTMTNYGFAFNEGWAEFWAGQCISELCMCS